MDNIRSVPSSLRQKRSRFLKWLAGSGSHLDLMELVNKRFRPVAPQISEKVELAIREQIKYEGWPMPDVLSICPLNSPACLLHYRVLVFLHLQLSEEKRDQFKSWEGERASSTSTTIPDLSLVSPSSASESHHLLPLPAAGAGPESLPSLSLPADSQPSMSHLPTSSVPITTPGPVHTHPLHPPHW